MNYFERFKGIEAREGLTVQKPIDGELAAFIRKSAENPEIFKPDFLKVDLQYSIIDNAFYAVLAAKYYLDDESAEECFEEYNKFVSDSKSEYRKLGAGMYSGGFYYPNFTAYDYYLNHVFGRKEEAEKVLDHLAERFEPTSLTGSKESMLALTTSGRTELVKSALANYKREEFILPNGLMQSGGRSDIHGGKILSHSYGIQDNCILGTIYHHLGEFKKRDELIRQAERFPICKNGLIFDFSQRFEESEPTKLLPRGQEHYSVFHSAIYLELLKLADKEKYLRTREAMMQYFRAEADPTYFAFLVAAQPAEMFPK